MAESGAAPNVGFASTGRVQWYRRRQQVKGLQPRGKISEGQGVNNNNNNGQTSRAYNRGARSAKDTASTTTARRQGPTTAGQQQRRTQRQQQRRDVKGLQPRGNNSEGHSANNNGKTLRAYNRGARSAMDTASTTTARR